MTPTDFDEGSLCGPQSRGHGATHSGAAQRKEPKARVGTGWRLQLGGKMKGSLGTSDEGQPVLVAHRSGLDLCLEST